MWLDTPWRRSAAGPVDSYARVLTKGLYGSTWLYQSLDVKQLALANVHHAVTSAEHAFLEDPLQLYFRAWDQVSSLSRLATVATGWAKLAQRISLTIDQGAALVVASPAPSSVISSAFPLSMIHTVFGLLICPSAWFRHLFNRILYTPVQSRRMDEIQMKMGDFMSLDFLSCTSAQQNRGYGGALVREVTKIVSQFPGCVGLLNNPSKAAKHGHKVWLLSSNLKNSPFYQSHGFEVVGVLAVGDSDPDYHGEPIRVETFTMDERHLSSAIFVRIPMFKCLHPFLCAGVVTQVKGRVIEDRFRNVTAISLFIVVLVQVTMMMAFSTRSRLGRTILRAAGSAKGIYANATHRQLGTVEKEAAVSPFVMCFRVLVRVLTNPITVL
ncbi:hypothetical protein K488DRAFT_72129 [Vararia minispora EC-137]|uniref:Uncharacterized protein n=1 Tax=Vararia minispora EC-137 TaxID=1314806 RepID=A0ACB8QFL5_9AGAM|nr:hypothetical protein K488DRAFT_72129 [Vararia minispora EC-137]